MREISLGRNYLFLLLLVLSIVPLAGQTNFWELLPKPEGGYIRDFAVSPDGTIYTVSSPIFRSTDNGHTWTATNSYPNPYSIFIYEDGSLLTTGGETLYKSTDAGETWIEVPGVHFYSDIGGEDGVQAFAMTTGRVLYAISALYVFRLKNDTWERVPTKSFIGYPRTLSADSLGHVVIGTTHGLFYMNEDADSGWAPMQQSGIVLSTAYASAGYWFCSDFRSIYRTRYLDSSRTEWDTVYQHSTSHLQIRSLRVRASGEIFALVGSGELLQSSDTGTTWTPNAPPLLSAYSFSATNDLLGSQWGVGAIRSSDDGETWDHSNSGMQSVAIEDITVTPAGTLYIATSGWGILRSNNRGDTWESAYLEKEYNGFSSISITSQGSILASYGYSGIDRSGDEGISWQQVFEDRSADMSGLLSTRSGTTYGWRKFKPIVRSTDDGQTWEVLENSPRIWGNLCMDSTGGLWTSEFMLSDDNGIHWDTLQVPSPATQGFAILTQHSGALIATTDAGVIRSTNHGKSWITISRERPSGNSAYVIASIGDGNIFIADSNKSVYLSTDNGTTWQSVPLPAPVNAIAADSNGYIYAATWQGVYRSRERQILSSAPISQKAQEKLEIDYRDGILTLHSDISYAGPATLTVTTLDGRQISTYDTDLQGQTYAAKFPLPNLATGVYLCQIYSNNQLFSSRFVVLR